MIAMSAYNKLLHAADAGFRAAAGGYTGYMQLMMALWPQLAAAMSTRC